MGTTTNGIPYPELNDQPNLPTQAQALANAVDGLFGTRSVPLTMRQLLRSTTLSASNGSNPVQSWPDTGYNLGGITYGGGIATVPVTGMYEWSAQAVLPGGSGRVDMYIQKNGSSTSYSEGSQSASLISNLGQNLTAGAPVQLAANDQVQLLFFYTGSGTLTISPRMFSLWRLT